MALTTDQKLEKVWEWFSNNADTSTAKQFYEETIARASEVHASEVFAEPIPSVPPASSTAVVKKWYPVAEGGEGWLVLTVDRSVANNRTWVALPAHSGNWSSGSADTSQVLKGFISPKYGKQYLVKVFAGNDSEIPQLDSSDWTFDYSAGVLTFNSANRSESGNTPADSIKLKVFQYIGKQLLEVVGTGVGGRLVVRGDLIGISDGVNTQYQLPAPVDSGVYFEIRCSKVPLDADDYSINGTQVTLAAAPLAYQTPDIVYYLPEVA